MDMRRWVWDRHDHVRPGWKVCLFGVCLVAWMLLISTVMRPLQATVPEAVLPPNFAACIGAILATWCCLLAERKPLSWVGVKLNRTFLRNWMLGLLLGGGLLGLVAVGVWVCGGFHLLAAPSVTALLLRTFWLFLLGAVFEELTFRGYPFQRGIEGMGLTSCQILFASLFVLAHVGSPALRHGAVLLPMLTVFLAAMLLGYCYWITRSLALPLGVHMGWNWM